MFAALQIVIAPLLAAAEARFTAVTTLMLRRALLLIAAALFGIGALMFLSVGLFFALTPGLGPGGAALLLALVWALLAGICVLLARTRPRVVAAPAPGIAATRPAPVIAPAALGASPVAQPPPLTAVGRLRARIGRAAPLFAIGALVAGIIAGRR